MLTPDEAEKTATQAIVLYVNACQCNTTEDVGNVLMKLLSSTGQALLATQGQDKAVAMIEGTAAHIAKAIFREEKSEFPGMYVSPPYDKR